MSGPRQDSRRWSPLGGRLAVAQEQEDKEQETQEGAGRVGEGEVEVLYTWLVWGATAGMAVK